MSRHARGARYGRYVEGPDPLAPPVDLGDALMGPPVAIPMPGPLPPAVLPMTPIPNVDPATGSASPEVLATLSAYRADARLAGAISFGMNCVIVQGAGATLRAGDAVAADWRFD